MTSQLDSLSLAAAGFHVDVFPADSLALEGRTVSHGNRNFGNGYLEAADFYGLGHDILVRNVGNHVLVRAHACGENLRNGGVGDGREAVVDDARCRGIPFIANVSESQDERENAVFVVNEDLAEIAGLDTAEAQCRASGKSDGENR